MQNPLGSQRLTLIRRIPMSLMSILVGVLCGVVVWLFLDHVQPRAVRAIFSEELQSRLEQQASETLVRFDKYMQTHISTTRLLANHRELANYLEPVYWFDSDRIDPTNHFQRPSWLPPESQWQALVQPSHILLLDLAGRVRETFHADQRLLPDRLRAGVEPGVDGTRVNSRLMLIEQQPHLLVSEVAEDAAGTEMGSLLLVVPLDQSFLRASQQGVSADGVLVGILDATGSHLLAVSNETVVPRSTRISEVQQQYLVTVQPFSGRGYSESDLRFATLVPLALVDAVQQRVTELDRRQRLVAAVSFIAAFALVFFFLSQRLNLILQRISRFSRRALGTKQPVVEPGNQLLVLEDWIQQFIQLVRETRDEMRREHESEIKESEALKQAIMETSLDSIVTVNEDGQVIEFNPTAEHVFGYRREQVIGELFAGLLLAEESVPQFIRLFSGLLHDEPGLEGVRHQMVALRAGAEAFPVELAIRPIKLQESMALTVYIHDASERKKAESEIRDLARLTSESPNPVLRVNRRGVILYANHASDKLLQYWGCERGQTLPQYWRDLVVRSLELDDPYETQVVSDERTFVLMLMPVADADYVNIYGRDITAVKDAESLARQHQQELVHVSRLSTMGEMATGLAHELNQPLSAITNYASGSSRRLSAQPDAPEDILFALDQINLQADRAGEIIKRLRGMVAKQPAVKTVADINDLVSEVCSFIEFEAKKEGVVVEQKLDIGPLKVRVDVVQIEQVILNLLRNALDALMEIPEDKRRLLIETGCSDQSLVYVRVIDSGKGIADEVAEHLFQPFFTTKKKGIGVGLAISQTIVEDHDGTITARSADDGGACFVLSLPGVVE